MTDIDHFKKVNDRFGHDMGDLVLKKYAALMKECTRAEDLVTRFGGEEFIILLPLTESTQAHMLAERIRTRLEQMNFIEKHRITASYGIASYRKNDSMQAMIKRVDTALYTAKNTGRNRTVLAEA